ncbi:MAG: hypothetical protein EA351_09820 [Gemmatimonadales bacterium]|nr:MAG: hypothetical protein EA351_09820 [Gemmatimonadales bacterium]
MSERRNLGQVLLDLGRITKSEQKAALEYQKQHGGFFGEALTHLGFISAEELEFALAAQFDLPYIFPDAEAIDRDIASLVTPEWALSNLALPISRAGGTLVVVVDSPLKDTVVRELKHKTGLGVELAIASPGKIRTLIRSVFDQGVAEADSGLREVVSVERFLELAMDEGAEKLGISIRGRTAMGWIRVDGGVRRVTLAAGWPRAMAERMDPHEGVFGPDDGDVRAARAASWRATILWEGTEVPVEVSSLTGGVRREVLINLLESPVGDRVSRPAPPSELIHEARLIRRSGSARFAVRCGEAGKSEGILRTLPTTLFGSETRAAHLETRAEGGVDPSNAPEEELLLRLPDPKESGAVEEFLEKLKKFDFDAVSVDAGEDAAFWIERLIPVSRSLLVDMPSSELRTTYAGQGISWEIEVEGASADDFTWRLFPISVSH